MLPKRMHSPLERCRGMSPAKLARCLADAKRAKSPTSAIMVNAVTTADPWHAPKNRDERFFLRNHLTTGITLGDAPI